MVGRISGYQIYQGTGFDSPLVPSAHSAPRNFGRFEGGVQIVPFPGASFVMLGGEDVGDSHRQCSKMISRAGSGCIHVIRLIFLIVRITITKMALATVSLICARWPFPPDK
jgi:hypothetical protein